MKNRSRTYHKVLICCIFLLLITGCTSEKNKPKYIDPTAHPELVDQSWFTGQPCSAPCWQGLEAGKSFREEALNTARRLNFIGEEEAINPDDSWSHFYCKNPSKEPCISMRFENGVLAEIDLYPNYSVTLDQAVKYLGEPDFFTSIELGELKYSCNLRFIWLQQRFELYTGDEPHGGKLCDQIYRENGKVPKELMNQTVDINSIGRMNEILKKINLPMSGYLIWIWAGFSE